MDIIIAIAATAIGCAAVFVAVLRRAEKKPDGKTATVVKALSGPGPWKPPK